MQSTATPSDLERSNDAIGALVRRLARPHPSGGVVIERSVILAEGSRSKEILGWIAAHDGVADSTTVGRRKLGLHGAYVATDVGVQDVPARRFVLPARAFD
jgi:hypothetical protein